MTFDVSKVLPGWRGTDPDGGTWVRVDWVSQPWWYVSADGQEWGYRSQEEAEAAGLVPLRADGPASALIRAGADATRPPRRSVAAPLGVDELAQVIREVDGNHTLGAGALAEAIVEHLSPAAAPAPLDPGNPEDWAVILRLASKVVTTRGHDPSNLNTIMDAADYLTDTADRLDRERAEAEQDRKDRKLADDVVTKNDFAPGASDYILAGIRAERARQEAGQ